MTVASSLALLSLLFPPVSIVSSASVALVTLRRGAGEGIYILIISCLATALLGVLLFGSYQFALLYGLVLWLPVWLISIVLREGQQLSVAVEIAVVLGALGVLGFYLYHPEPATFWNGVLKQMMRPMMNDATDVPLDELRRSLDHFARLMTGAVAAGTVYGMLFGLFLGRWWQAILFNPGGFKAEFLALRTHPQLAIATIVIVLTALLVSGTFAEICWNIVVLLFVLYAVIGTAVLHATFSRLKNSRFMVPFLYITLLLIPHVAIAVAMFGLGDTWLNLRNKISNKEDV